MDSYSTPFSDSVLKATSVTTIPGLPFHHAYLINEEINKRLSDLLRQGTEFICCFGFGYFMSTPVSHMEGLGNY